MKLRIRIRQRTERMVIEAENGDEITLEKLLSAVANCGVVHGEFQLSLNGRDPLEGKPEDSLKSFGIVSGDLIKVLVPDEGDREVNVRQENRNEASARRDVRINGSISTKSTSSDSSVVADQNQRHTAPASASANGGMGNHDNTHRDDVMSEEEKKEAMEQLAKLEEQFGVGDLISDPLLCRDAAEGKIPVCLRQLVQHASPESPAEALCLVLHILMLETGFDMLENNNSESEIAEKKIQDGGSESEDRTLPDLATLPEGWKTGSSYKLTYRHAECEGSSFVLAAIPFTSNLVLNGMTGKKLQVTTQVKPETYVAFNEGDVTFSDLAELSRVFKNSVAFPLLAKTREELGLPPLHGLLTLAPEIQLKVLSFLDAPHVMLMSTMCRHFYSLANDNALWRLLLTRDFGSRISDQTSNWKDVYKDHYKLKRLRRIQAFYYKGRKPFAFVPPLPSPMPGIYPPGYRGGEYDLDPFRSGAALPGYPIPGLFPPIAGPVVPGPRHDPIFPNPDSDLRPGHGGGLRDLEVGRPHPYAPNMGLGAPFDAGRRAGGRTGGGSGIRGLFFR